MVVVGDVLVHQRAAVGQAQTADGAVVLDRDGNPRERSLVARADRIGRGERALAVDLHERVQLGIELLDPIERDLHELARGDLPGAHHAGELDRGTEHQIAVRHGSSSSRETRHHMGLPRRQPPVKQRAQKASAMSAVQTATPEVQSGLEGVVAFATEIAEPDKAGGALRYRGVDIEDLVGTVPYEQVWGLLVDGHLKPGLPPAEPHALTVRSGDHRVDVQSALAMLAPEWGFGQLIDITDEEARDNLARASVMALSFVAQSARESGQPPVPQEEIDQGKTIPERFLIRWRGEANPDHVKAIDAYWVSAAEHGMNASTFTARVVASTGADCAAALSAAVGALSGPLHGGAPSRVLKMLDEVEQTGDAERWVSDALDRGERLMGFGHRVYRAEDPRARVLRRTCRELGSPRFQAAEALEKAALAELHARRPDRVLATNVEFWSAVVLDLAEVPPELFTPMFTCARVAGWSAHILEQKREAKLIRPTAIYVGEPPRSVAAVA